ncbi:DUF5455 family protein [Staphylococcus aureus]|uniref:DUF5455 family protein n=1 Tax=Staphylococcus aureus TaxID=1280 RepID=UPI00301D9A9E
MAVPAVIGVTAILNFLIKLVEWVVAKFAARFTARLAASLGWATFYIALLAGLAGTISLIISGVSTALPSDLAQGIAMIKPANFEACVAAIYSAKVAMWVFHHKKQLIEWEQMRRFI